MEGSRFISRLPPRRYLALGAVLLLLAPLFYVALATWGVDDNPASGPSTPAFRVANSSVSHLCGNYQDEPLCPATFNENAGSYANSYYDPVSQNTVVIGNPGAIFLYRHVLGPKLNVTVGACVPNWVYPGPGAEVAISCSSAHDNASIVMVDTTDGTLVGTIPFGASSSLSEGWAAMDLARSVLYVVGSTGTRTNGTYSGTTWLASVDLENRSILGKVAYPAAANGRLALDPVRNRILYTDFANLTLDELDPVTGDSYVVLSAGVNFYTFAVDPWNSELLVGVVYPGNQTPKTWAIDLNSLRVTGELPFIAGAGIVDPTTKQLFVWSGTTVAVLDGPSGNLIGIGTVPVPAWAGEATIVPGTNEFVFGAESTFPGEVWVTTITLGEYPVSGPAFEAVPFVGTSFPSAVGLGTVMVGLGVLLVRGVPEARARRLWERRTQEEFLRN